jgi:hypothetical protein
MRKLFLYLLSLLSVTCQAQEVNPIVNGSTEVVVNASGNVITPNITEDLPANPIFLIFDIGQSNSVGRAQGQRVLLGSIYPEILSMGLVYWKPDYTATDNGNWYPGQLSAFMCREPDASSSNFAVGSYLQLATLLTGYTQDSTYVIVAGDGGTALNQNTTTPDWAPASSGECFEIFTQRYYSVAYTKLQTRYPGRNIVPIILWHQGEADALNSTATANYTTNFPAFVTAIRASHASLANALWVTTKLWYESSANEATINAVFESYAATHSNFKVVDISDQPKKIQLSTADKLGVTPAGTLNDDIHTSWRGQNAKAERSYNAIMNYYGITTNTGEITNNTNYDPSVLTTTGCRLQCNRSNTTFDDYFTTSAYDNDLSTGTFNSVTGTVKLKIDLRKGWGFTVNASSSRVNSSAAIGSTVFSGSFSVGGWFNPRDGQTTNAQYLFSDVQAFGGSLNNNRMGVLILPTGQLQAFVARSGVAPETDALPGTGTRRLATTLNPIFTDGLQKGPKHIAVVFNNGGSIQIYVNGSLVTLHAVENGNISAVDLPGYTNATTTFTFFSRRTAASTWDFPYYGMYRELIMQKVAWSGSDVLNIMSN